MAMSGARGAEMRRVQDRETITGEEAARRAQEYGQGLLDIPGSVQGYFSDRSAGDVARDAGQFGRTVAAGAAQDPVGFALDMVPVVGEIRAMQAAEELRTQARQLEESGDTENAKTMRQLASVSMAGAVPLIGTLRRATAAGTRPRIVSTDDGTYITTRPEGMDAPGTRTDRVLEPDEMERILADPDANRALQVANDYTMETLGVPYERVLDMPESSLAKQSAIARTFDLAVEGTPEYKRAVFDSYAQRFPDLVEQSGARNYDQLVERAYTQLGQETQGQFSRMPIQQTFHPGNLEYPNSRAMVSDVLQNENLNVFRGGDRHDFLHAVDPATGLNTNEMFRGVHDYFGHAIRGNQFGPRGEEIAYGSHAQMYSPLARAAAASETRGQNSNVNYGTRNLDLMERMRELRDMRQDARSPEARADIDRQLRELGGEWNYADQSAVLLPPEMTDIGYRGGMPDYIRGLIDPAPGTTVDGVQATHFGRQSGLMELDPGQYGTGARGAEAPRVQYGGAPPRSYFYEGTPDSVRRESMVPNRATYEAELSGLYDLSADPLDLRRLSRLHNTTPRSSRVNPGTVDRAQMTTDVERMVREHGYSGLLGDFPGNPDRVSRPLMTFDPTPVREVR